MPPPLTITAMAAGDLVAVTRLDGENPSGWTASHFQQQLAHNHGFALVARFADSGEVVGFICGVEVAGEAEIHKIAVARQWRRQGIGRRLLQHTLTALQAAAIFLELRASNLPARNLYETLGFSRCGLRKKYYSSPTEDAIIMELQRP